MTNETQTAAPVSLEALERKWRTYAATAEQHADHSVAPENREWYMGRSEAFTECADDLATLRLAQSDNSALMPTIMELSQTNPVVRMFCDWHEHAQRRGYPFSLHSMLAQLIAEMDRRHEHLEKLTLKTLSTIPCPFNFPAALHPAPSENES